ncbi:hypothetical protein Rsub_01678 [Raphidocelis subcapitata]|uniref:Uncharacterized protein n=1 Tax=Raphidocelis subcapitata TaxID=307507 RepID=A0A2V0NV09_9CHLO|nr:hypothetical protein Rsub_01678 [Raphidocelis subcapitata]|eukprot:GBF88777.1 hypothetical protein Rsub_01678 [Raphidocelis subcapitata]
MGMKSRTALLLALLGAAALPRAARAADCAPAVTFFPPGAEDFNVPIAWGRTQQRKAGNPYTDQLFTVVLSSRDNLRGSFAAGVPTLQVQPVHPLLTVGAVGINASCRGMTKPPAKPLPATQAVATAPRFQVSYLLNPVHVPPPPAPDSVDKFVARYGAANATINPDMAEAEVARQISKLQELTVSTNATVADSARKALQAYATQQRLKSEEEARERQEVIAQEAAAARGKWGRSTPLQQNVMVGEYASVSPPPRIRLEGLEDLPDGYYCMQVIVTILRNTGYIGESKVPQRDLSTTREVCFYKLDKVPTARVKFNTCGPKFSMEVTDITPVPVEVFPGTNKMLFTPVYHIKGALNKTAQWWVPIPEGNRLRFDYWAVVGRAPSNETTYDYAPEDITLAEGWWNVEIDGGLLSEFPSLLSTDAVGQFGKKEEEPDELGVWRDMPSALQGLTKFAAGKTNMTRLLGLQSKEVGFNSLNGPDGGIALNEEFTFSWEIDGFGHQYCYLDGERRQNDADFMCRSPLGAQVNDGEANHTLVIMMQDVCGSKVKVLAKYGTWGYALEDATKRPERTYDSAPVPSTLAEPSTERHSAPHISQNKTDARRIRSGAAARGGGGGAARGLAAAGGALLLAAALAELLRPL